jgi:hypothetical protein
MPPRRVQIYLGILALAVVWRSIGVWGGLVEDGWPWTLIFLAPVYVASGPVSLLAFLVSPVVFHPTLGQWIPAVVGALFNVGVLYRWPGPSTALPNQRL